MQVQAAWKIQSRKIYLAVIRRRCNAAGPKGMACTHGMTAGYFLGDKMLRWFRFYGEALNDPKVQTLEPSVFKIWVNCLCLACNLQSKDGNIGTIDDVSFALRETVSTVTSAFHALEERGLIETKNETFHIPAWRKRQYKSDSSTERVRRHRKRYSNVTVTAPDTDTDTDTEKKHIPPPNPPQGGAPANGGGKAPSLEYLDLFPVHYQENGRFRAMWESWLRHRREKRSKVTPTAARRQVKILTEAGLEDAVGILDQSITNGWTGLFPLKRRGVGSDDEPMLDAMGRPMVRI